MAAGLILVSPVMQEVGLGGPDLQLRHRRSPHWQPGPPRRQAGGGSP